MWKEICVVRRATEYNHKKIKNLWRGKKRQKTWKMYDRRNSEFIYSQ